MLLINTNNTGSRLKISIFFHVLPTQALAAHFTKFWMPFRPVLLMMWGVTSALTRLNPKVLRLGSFSLLNSFNRREIRSKYSLLSSASQNLWTNGRKSPKLITSKSGGKWGKIREQYWASFQSQLLKRHPPTHFHENRGTTTYILGGVRLRGGGGGG